MRTTLIPVRQSSFPIGFRRLLRTCGRRDLTATLASRDARPRLQRRGLDGEGERETGSPNRAGGQGLLADNGPEGAAGAPAVGAVRRDLDDPRRTSARSTRSSIVRPDAAALVRSVVIEEMLHAALVSNLLNAIGGKPSLAPELVPQYPGYIPHHAAGGPFIQLQALSPTLAETVFMAIEQPGPSPHAPPEGHRFRTIGQFYKAIEVGFKNCAHLHHDLFDHPGVQQSDTYFGDPGDHRAGRGRHAPAAAGAGRGAPQRSRSLRHPARRDLRALLLPAPLRASSDRGSARSPRSNCRRLRCRRPHRAHRRMRRPKMRAAAVAPYGAERRGGASLASRPSLEGEPPHQETPSALNGFRGIAQRVATPAPR
jgi:hypothetical protein